jgi:GNAT superfamily N-acetyltransferase
MNYRLATESDAHELARLRWDFRLEETDGYAKTPWEQFGPICAEFIVTGMAAGDWAYWVSEEGDHLTGCVCIRVFRKIPKPNKLDDLFGYVTNVYMQPGSRNAGYGSKLLAKAIEWARAEGISELLVQPSERSMPYYMRQGFEPDGEAMHIDLEPYVV